MYINNKDQLGESSFIGKKAEESFEDWLKDNNREYRPATTQEQYDHIDFVVFKLNKSVNIEVKATKKKSRMDSHQNSQYIWIEFKNVRGDNGWLYGKADYIAFYKKDENSFYIIDRKELVKLCESICDDTKVTNPKEALYHKYTREGRKDVLSLIYFDDILKCNYKILKK
jgi:hypothetical protein